MFYRYRFLTVIVTFRVLTLSTLLCGCLMLAGCGSKTASEDPAASADEGSADELSVEQVLEKLAATYQNAKSYRDQATYHETFVAKQTGVMQTPTPHRVAVTFTRPNRFRVERIAYNPTDESSEPGLTVIAASDGETLRATLSGLPDQVLEKPAPEVVTKKLLAPDPLLDANLIPVPLENLYPQLDLLLATDEAPQSVFDAEKAKLLSSDSINGRDCYRVQLDQADGKRVLWIDQKRFFLRRLEAPTEAAREQLDPDNVLSDLKLWLEFSDAVFDVGFPDEAFQVTTPADAEIVEAFDLPADAEASPSETDEASDDKTNQ